jgi:nucleotide-binding universal stress UspA family protein
MVNIQRILVPVDFSKCSRGALVYAAHFGNRLGATAIDVLHVWRPPHFIDVNTMIQSEDGKAQTLAEFARSKVGGQMKDFLTEVEAGGEFEVHGRLESGDPDATILRVAAEGYHLVIMGTHGDAARSGLGSIAQRVVHQAPCPVLTIREGVKPDGG